MNSDTRDRLLKLALTAFGAVFILIYPLGMIWPSGWVWHGGQGKYYLQMICGVYAVLGVFLIAAARNPSAHRSLILFTVWSSIVHAASIGHRLTATRGCIRDFGLYTIAFQHLKRGPGRIRIELVHVTGDEQGDSRHLFLRRWQFEFQNCRPQ